MSHGGVAKLYEHFEPPERLTLLIEAMARNDDGEADRLQRSCPRATYTGRDPAFEERFDMAFDILAVVSIDLRCMWGKLHVLQWVVESVHPIATGQHITAALAFVEGIRCGRGLPQCEFFVKPLPEPAGYDQDDLLVPDDDGEGDDGDEEGDEEVTDPTPRQVDEGLRLDAVEKRSEHFTNCGMVLLLKAADGIARDLVNTWAAFGRFCHTRVGVSPETMLRAWQFPLAEFQETLKRWDKTKPDPEKVKEYFGHITKQWDRRFRPKPPGHEYVTYADEGDDGGRDCG